MFPKHDQELELLAEYHAEDTEDSASVSWIRDTDEKARRRPADVALLVVSVAALFCGMWAQTQSTVNVNLFRALNDLSGNMVGIAKAMYALGSIWAVLAVTLLLLVTRQFRGAWHGLLAGSGAWGLALLLNEILGTHTITGLGVNVRIGDGPAYPVANVAAVTALAFGIAPYLVRPLRRILAVVILLVCAAAMYLGAGFPADVLGGLLVGFGIAALVRVVFGAPGGQPSIDEVRTALTELGYDVATIAPADEQIPRAAVMDVSSRRTSGCASTRSGATSATPGSPRRSGTRRCTTTRTAGVRQPDPAGRAHRLLVDARRARRGSARRDWCGPGWAAPMPRCSSPPRPPAPRSRRSRPNA